MIAYWLHHTTSFFAAFAYQRHLLTPYNPQYLSKILSRSSPSRAIVMIATAIAAIIFKVLLPALFHVIWATFLVSYLLTGRHVKWDWLVTHLEQLF